MSGTVSGIQFARATFQQLPVADLKVDRNTLGYADLSAFRRIRAVFGELYAELDYMRGINSGVAEYLTTPNGGVTATLPITALLTNGAVKISLTTPLAVAYGGTGLTAGSSGGVLGFTATGTIASSAALTQYAIVIGGGPGATPATPVALGSANQILQSAGAGANPAWSTATYPATVTANRLLWASGTNAISDLATANSGVLVTSGAGVPSIATDIPTAVTIGGAYIYRAGGTRVGLADGGTNVSLVATGGAGQYLKQSGVGANITVGTIPASDIASGAALTKGDDTNVTLTLGGASASALLAAASITAGWSGTLANARGGLGGDVSSTTANYIAAGPTSGAAGAVSMRAMVSADLGTTLAPQHARIGIGAAADANHLIEAQLGSITTDKRLFDGSATWNAGLLTFYGMLINITNVASAATSRLFALNVGGATKFDVSTGGDVTAAGNVAVALTSSARQNLSIGSYLDLYSGSANSPTVPSIRGSSINNLTVNAYSTGIVYLAWDGGTGGVKFGNGGGVEKGSIDSSGNLTVAGFGSFNADSTFNNKNVSGVANLAATTAGIGGTRSSNVQLHVLGTLSTGGDTWGVHASSTYAPGNGFTAFPFGVNAKVDNSSGSVTASGLAVYDITTTGTGTTANMYGLYLRALTGAASTKYAIYDTTGFASVFSAPVGLKGYTVAGLPAGVTGQIAYATDLLAPTFLGNATGGGAVVGPVFYDGANWKTV